MQDFDTLVAEATAATFAGWDFSWLEGRWIEGPIPWDYRGLVMARFAAVQSLLDLGTGGGEMLASMAPLPPDTWATENYPPNGPLARARLEPLGVRVVTGVPDDALPFRDASFDLVIDRHESYDAAELFRIVKPGGRFVTQQVGGQDNLRLNELLQNEVSYEFADWEAGAAVSELEAAGFRIADLKEAALETRVTDIGAVVYYLRAIPWQIEGFTVEGYRDRLLALHEQMVREGGLALHSHRFLIEAVKPHA
ncbi:MAG: class I SAM-dependent methyltransferase [Caldilineales bacterium]